MLFWTSSITLEVFKSNLSYIFILSSTVKQKLMAQGTEKQIPQGPPTIHTVEI